MSAHRLLSARVPSSRTLESYNIIALLLSSPPVLSFLHLQHADPFFTINFALLELAPS